MSLIKYSLQYSAVPVEDRQALFDRIDHRSFMGLDLDFQAETGTFYWDSDRDLKILDLPACCPLRQIFQ